MIPGVATVHARSAWVDPRFPITGPATNWPAIDTAAIHYTGADDLIDGDPGEHAENLPAYFRAMQRAYANTRGFSLGYWWGVDWLGGAWQIRGWEFQSAANAGHNGHTGPILVLVDGNDAATDEAAHTIRCLVAEGERRAARSWAIKGHGQLRRETGIGTATACCGIGLQAQVDAGVFVPRPTITPPITTEDCDMIAIDYTSPSGQWTALTYTGSHLAHVRTSEADAIIRRANVQRQPVTATELDALILSAATTTQCPPEWVNTARGAAWTAQRA